MTLNFKIAICYLKWIHGLVRCLSASCAVICKDVPVTLNFEIAICYFFSIWRLLLHLMCGRGRPVSAQLRMSYQTIAPSILKFTSWIESFRVRFHHTRDMFESCQFEFSFSQHQISLNLTNNVTIKEVRNRWIISTLGAKCIVLYCMFIDCTTCTKSHIYTNII